MKCIQGYGTLTASLLISMTLLDKATQALPIGIAYAVWTGIGASGSVLIGILVLKSPLLFYEFIF